MDSNLAASRTEAINTLGLTGDNASSVPAAVHMHYSHKYPSKIVWDDTLQFACIILNN